MSARREFVMWAEQPDSNLAELCRRFGISRKTGYKWLARFAEGGVVGLADRSRRPAHSPRCTPEALQAAVLALRRQHPAWGARKLQRRLAQLGHRQLPAPSTLTAILRRHGCLNEEAATQHRAFRRFEHPAPNDLWQMDFKGHFALEQGRCHALGVLDDHSRFNLLLQACADEQSVTVQERLTRSFRCYGLPARMSMDNGAPWGSDLSHWLTPLTVWLLRLDIRVSHSRPYHPQTQGKQERFHRTLQEELLRWCRFRDLGHCQWHFDRFRHTYNFERPHEALALAVPASRYRPSARAFPELLPAIEYPPGATVRKVQDKGQLYYRGRVFRIAKALRGYPVALRPSVQDGHLLVYFCHQQVAQLDLRHPDE